MQHNSVHHTEKPWQHREKLRPALKLWLSPVKRRPRILSIMKDFAALRCLLTATISFGLLGLFPPAYGQPVTAAQNGSTMTEPARTVDSVSGSKQDAGSQVSSHALRIGPGDELEVTVFGASDLSQHVRVASDGNISIPLLGSIHVAGATSAEAEGMIAEQLQQKGILNHPQVSVFVKEYTNSEISVVGEVNKPGVYSSLGPHRLFDILQTAGGLTEKAANTVTISHREGGDAATVTVSQNDPATMARSNVELLPGDTVIVPKAGIVYVLGEVNRPGGYISSSTVGVTVLQVMAAAGGPTQLASAGKTKMLRRGTNGVKEIPVPLQKLMEGKKPDMAVQPDDILYVPTSRLKSVLSLGSIITLSSQAAVYRIP
jgi:polysaccharide export outer membrane protein